MCWKYPSTDAADEQSVPGWYGRACTASKSDVYAHALSPGAAAAPGGVLRASASAARRASASAFASATGRVPIHAATRSPHATSGVRSTSTG